MGVDFYGCHSCGESRYEEYVASCPCCGHRVCTSCVVNDDINSRYAYDYGVKYDGTKEQIEEYGITYEYELGEIIDDTGIAPKYCPFCNGTKVNDKDLLNFLISNYGFDRNKVKLDFLASKKKR